MLHSEIYSIWLMVNTDTFLFSGQKRGGGGEWEKKTTAQPNEKQNVWLKIQANKK